MQGYCVIKEQAQPFENDLTCEIISPLKDAFDIQAMEIWLADSQQCYPGRFWAQDE